MKNLQRDFGSAIIMVTHDLGVVAEVADDVLVMYAGRVAEQGSATDVFYRPSHPYTWGLLGSLPRLTGDESELRPIPGQPPSLLNPPPGVPLQRSLSARDGRLPGSAAAAGAVRGQRRAPGGLPPRRGHAQAQGGGVVRHDDGPDLLRSTCPKNCW